MGCFIACHVGAGFHSHAKEAAYKQVLHAAVAAGMAALASGNSSLDAAVAVTQVLEDSGIVNAGSGCNLTREGAAEADASIMCGNGTFGAIGAAPGITHPTAAAARLALDSLQLQPCGLIPPIFLAGHGAWAWARAAGLAAAPTADEAPQWLAGSSATDAWHRYTALLAEEEQRLQSAQDMLQAQELLPQLVTADHHHQHLLSSAAPPVQAHPSALPSHLGEVGDTVGCIVIDSCGRLAASVSSGGLAMKRSGRVGEAAMHGAGCWAQDAALPGSPVGAVLSISGVGERIMRCHLARVSALDLITHPSEPAGDVCTNALQQHILSAPGPWDCGVLAARVTVHGPCGAVNSPVPILEGAGREVRQGSLQCTTELPSTQQEHPSNSGDRSSHASGSSGTSLLKEATSGSTVEVEFVAAHTSTSFGIAYQAHNMDTPCVQLLRQPPPGQILGLPPNKRRRLTHGGQPLTQPNKAGTDTAGVDFLRIANHGNAVHVTGYSCNWPLPGEIDN